MAPMGQRARTTAHVVQMHVNTTASPFHRPQLKHQPLGPPPDPALPRPASCPTCVIGLKAVMTLCRALTQAALRCRPGPRPGPLP